MPNPAGFGELGFEQAVVRLEARLREALPAPFRRLSHSEIRMTYRQRKFERGWRLDMVCSDGVTRQIDLLVSAAFPLGYPRTALVDGPGQLVWPHVEHDGVLCLLPIMAEVDAEDPGAVALNLIGRSASLIEDLLKGEIIARDFREEFLTYWFYARDTEARITSLICLEGPSREVRLWREKEMLVVGENHKQLEQWVSNRFGKPRGSKRISTEAAAFLWLSEPPLPISYPQNGADLLTLAAAEGNEAKDLLVDLAANAQKDVIVLMGAEGRGGPGLIATMTTAGWKVPSRNGKVQAPLTKGFKPNGMSRAVAGLRTYSAAPLVKLEVSRADALWIHGRGKDGRSAELLKKTVTFVGCGSVGSSVAARLVRAGIGVTHLVDPDTLDWPNLARHELGADSIGENKATELSARLQRSFPHLSITGHAVSAQALIDGYEQLLAKSDLVVVATGSWAADGSLNRWHLVHDRERPFLYGWAESRCAAGHAVIIGPGDGCLRCGVNGTGKPLFEAIAWPEGSATLEEPACGNHFTPYGAIELGFVVDLIAGAALSALLTPPSVSQHRIWMAPVEQIRDSGGEVTEMMMALTPISGGQMFTRTWPTNECPSCAFAADYRSAA
jgi:sulfur-carrier protein adenylyltransferase/sulfurtransferase